MFNNKQLAILIVDDNIINQKVLGKQLKNYYKIDIIEFADNGKIAIDMASARKYDLIFMDISMPILDGISATKKIRDNNINLSTPIIGVSSEEEMTKQKAQDAGMNFVFNKPIDINLMKLAIDKCLSTKINPISIQEANENQISEKLTSLHLSTMSQK